MNRLPFSFRHGDLLPAREQRCIAFFGETPEMPTLPEEQDTKQEKSPDTPDDTREKNEQMEETLKKVGERIEQGDKAQKKNVALLESTEEFQKKHDTHNRLANDLENEIATGSKAAMDTAEGATDATVTVGLADNTNDIGREPATNAEPETTQTEANVELRPAEKGTAEEGVGQEQEAETTKETAHTNAPSETPEGKKPQ